MVWAFPVRVTRWRALLSDSLRVALRSSRQRHGAC